MSHLAYFIDKAYDYIKMDPFNNDENTGTEDDSLESAPNQLEQPSVPLNAYEPLSVSQTNDNIRPRSRRLIVILPLVVLVIALIFITIFLLSKPKTVKKPPATVVINTQSLSAGTLNSLENQFGTNPLKQQLTITPDTLFKNNVTVQGNLGASGTSSLQGAVTVGSNLLVDGTLTVGGSTNLGGNLNVAGLITAASISVGSFNISNINVSGNLNFGGHIIPSGVAPTATADLASGDGSVSVSGNDTAGTVTINVGNGALQAGEMAIIKFHTDFSTAPTVQLTPVNSEAAGLEYYSESATSFFSINTANAPAKGTLYTFYYLVTQ